MQKGFIQQYLISHDKLNIDEIEFETMVKTYKNTAYKLILIKLLCSYFYEIIIFGTDRPSKFVDMLKIYESIRCDLQKDKHPEIKNSLVLGKTDKIFNLYFK